MATGKGPIDTIGQVTTASLSNPKTQLKDMRKEVKDALKDFEKAKKAAKEAGTELTKNSKEAQRYTQAQNKLSGYVNQLKASNQRKNDFIRQRDEEQNGFMNRLDDANQRYHTIKSIFHTAKKSLEAFKDDTKREVVGKDINGNDIVDVTHHSTAYQASGVASDLAGKAFAASMRSGNVVGMAISGTIWAGAKAFKGKQDYNEAQRLTKLLQPLEQLDYNRSGLGGAADFGELKQAAERDFLRKNSDVMIGSQSQDLKFLIGGKTQESIARAQVALDPEKVRGMHSAVESTISQVASLRASANAALDLYDTGTYNLKIKEAESLLPNEKLHLWQNPIVLYTQREASREASKEFIRNNMAKAAIRTGD